MSFPRGTNILINWISEKICASPSSVLWVGIGGCEGDQMVILCRAFMFFFDRQLTSGLLGAVSSGMESRENHNYVSALVHHSTGTCISTCALINLLAKTGLKCKTQFPRELFNIKSGLHWFFLTFWQVFTHDSYRFSTKSYLFCVRLKTKAKNNKWTKSRHIPRAPYNI